MQVYLLLVNNWDDLHQNKRRRKYALAMIYKFRSAARGARITVRIKGRIRCAN